MSGLGKLLEAVEALSKLVPPRRMTPVPWPHLSSYISAEWSVG
jgi:hypothetical protein